MTNVSTFSSPLLYDKIAQEINTALGSTFDDQYPVCWMRTEEGETIPEVYKNDGSKINFRVMPNSVRSMSFFIIEGDIDELDEWSFQVPMAIICWLNLTEYSSSEYDYTTEIIRTVYNVLREYGCYDMSIDVNDPFGGFTMLEKEKASNTMRPYSAFKVSFSKNIGMCTV